MNVLERNLAYQTLSDRVSTIIVQYQMEKHQEQCILYDLVRYANLLNQIQGCFSNTFWSTSGYFISYNS